MDRGGESAVGCGRAGRLVDVVVSLLNRIDTHTGLDHPRQKNPRVARSWVALLMTMWYGHGQDTNCMDGLSIRLNFSPIDLIRPNHSTQGHCWKRR